MIPSSTRSTSRPACHCACQSKTMMSPSLPSPSEFPSCKTCLYSHPKSPNLNCCCVRLLSCVRLFVAPWIAVSQASVSFSISRSLLKFISIDLVMLFNCLILCFPFCLQSFPASGSFPMSQLFASGGQIIGAVASVLSMNIQVLFPLGLTGLISLLSKGLSRVFSSITVQKHQFFGTQPSLLHLCKDNWKNYSFEYMDISQHSDVSAF